ncbi:hypothetical protein [Roseovarius aestuarii]|nr:hypothetical protein [Roseovarius aestuarii]
MGNSGLSLNEVLQESLQSVPACQSACYVDMSAGLVLGTASEVRRPQEFYDRLADHAARLCMKDRFTIISTGASMTPFFLFEPSRVGVYLRNCAEVEHALCFDCTSVDDLELTVDRVRKTGHRINDIFGLEEGADAG